MNVPALITLVRILLLLVSAGLFVAVFMRLEDQKAMQLLVGLMICVSLLVALGAA